MMTCFFPKCTCKTSHLEILCRNNIWCWMAIYTYR